MIHGGAIAHQICIQGVSASAAGTVTSQIIDTIVNGQKAEFLTIPVFGTTADAVSNCPTVLKLQESDDTVTTNFANITAFVGGTATSSTVGFVIGNDVTATTTLAKYVFNVNLLPRKRYLRLLISPATSQTYYAVAELSRNAVAPTTLAGFNANANVVNG